MKDTTKKILITILKLAITVLIVWFIGKENDWRAIGASIKTANGTWLIVAVFVFVFSILLGALQWRVLLQGKNISISVGKAIKIYMTGIFFNNFMMGMVAGDAYKVTALHISGDSGKSAFASTFLDRLAGLMVLMSFAVIGGSYLLIRNMQSNVDLLPAITALAFCVSIFIFVSTLVVSQTLQRWCLALMDKLPSFLPINKVKEILNTVFINRRNHDERKMLGKVVHYSVLIQTLRISVHILCALAFGAYAHSRLPYFFIVIPIISLLMIVPLPIGGKELVQAKLYVMAGIDENLAITMPLIATAISIIGSFSGGITFLLGHKEEKK